MNYLDEADKRTIEYFKVLEPNFPEWLVEYINTEELLKQRYISITCGTIYSDLFERLKENGAPVQKFNLLIASIAISNNLILVTRNTEAFENIVKNSTLMIENWFE